MGRKVALGVLAAAGVAACAFLIGVLVLRDLAEAAEWAGVVAALATVVGVLAGLLSPAAALRPPVDPVPPALQRPEWAVDRPAELAAVVKALVRRRSGTAGIIVGLCGEGGFGKTTLAKMAGADPRVRRRFGGRVFLVTVGRDVQGADEIAQKVNKVIGRVRGTEGHLPDPESAGEQLGSLLDAGPRRLLILDDVWDAEQLEPLIQGRKRCARLVTTRAPDLLPRQGTAVRVDRMSPEQARELLPLGVSAVEDKAVVGLLAVTGRWPLLLRLVGRMLADYAKADNDASAVSAEAEKLAGQLAMGGPAAVDERAGDQVRALDVGKPDDRARAVGATIRASTGLLDDIEAGRFADLAVFAGDEPVPFDLVARLWRATARLERLPAAQVLNRLAQLGLITQVGGAIVLHDVIRDLLRAQMGGQALAELHARLLDAVAADLPAAPLDPAAGCMVQAAWWELGQQDRYLRDHLIEHLVDAERPGEAEAVATDLRWVAVRLERSGPAAPAADLAAAGTPRAARLREVLARAAHLLAPAEPAAAVVDVLCSRIGSDPDWGAQAAALQDQWHRPRLVSCWPLPDLSGSPLRRVLTGHRGEPRLTVAPDGSFLAASSDREVLIWDLAAAEKARAVLDPGGYRFKLAIAPDGTWLATACGRSVRIWDPVSGEQRAAPPAGRHRVSALAIAPDGTWLATASGRTVRIWDRATWSQRTALSAHKLWVSALVGAPDGTWLATVSGRTVRIWDRATGEKRAELSGHERRVSTIAIAPDGTWLATASGRTVRIWDRATWKQRAERADHKRRVNMIVIAPDSTRLATRSRSGWLSRTADDVRIWEANGPAQASVPGELADFAPDGSWLAVSTARSLSIWDPVGRNPRAVFTGHNSPISALAVAPDGSWLATAGGRTVRIWDSAAWQDAAEWLGGPRPVSDLAAAPDGSWLAATDGREVQILDTATGTQLAVLPGRAVAFSPDGSWLATSSSADGDAAARFRNPVTRLKHGALPAARCGAGVLAVADASCWLATTGNHRGEKVRVWDPATRQERAVLPGRVLAVAPDGSWLAASTGNGGSAWKRDDTELRIWDAASGRVRSFVFPARDRVSAVVIAPHASWLAIHGKSVRIWDLASSRVFPAGYCGLDSKAAVAPDGSWLAISNGPIVRVWDPATGRRLAKFKACRRRHAVIALVAAPDGTWLATRGRKGEHGRDRPMRIWDPFTGQKRVTLAGSQNWGDVMAISPDGAWLAISTPQTTTWQAVAAHESSEMPGRILDVAPDGSWLATGDSRKVHIWETATGRKRATLDGFKEEVRITAVTPDSTLLATATRTRDDSDSDWTIQVWDPTTGNAQALMRAENTINVCAWIATSRLALGGQAGIYVLDFVTPNPS